MREVRFAAVTSLVRLRLMFLTEWTRAAAAALLSPLVALDAQLAVVRLAHWHGSPTSFVGPDGRWQGRRTCVLIAGINVFENAVHSTRRQLRVVYAVMIAVSFFGIALGLLMDDKTKMVARMIAAGGLGALVFCPLFVLTLFPSRLLQLLREPHQIVWYYTFDRVPQRVMVGDVRGKIRYAEFATAADRAEALRLLGEIAPHARTGYTYEIYLAFKRNPEAFSHRQPD